jgi:sugar lactone lactonase YvrE
VTRPAARDGLKSVRRAEEPQFFSGGEVYVNINQNHKVVEYSSDGDKRAEFDVDGVIETNGIVVGADRDVYINIGDRLTRYSSSGEKLAEWSLHGLPDGLAAGPGEEVFVLVDDQMVMHSPEGQRLKELNVEDGAGVIASGPDGSIYLAYPQRVVRYTPNGEKQEEWMVEGAMSIDGIAVDGRGQVYVTINNRHSVVNVSTAGEGISQWDLEGNFSDVAISPEGLIFAADVDAGSVRAFQPRT